MIDVDGVLEAALGYMIHRPFWGKDYATEAAVACIDFVVEKLNRNRVITLIRPENRASLRVVQKIGMTPVKTTMFAGYEHLIYAVNR